MHNNSKTIWRKVRLGDVIKLKYGFALQEKYRKPGTVPVYGSSGIVGHNNEPMIPPRGIIIGRKGNVGSIYYSPVASYPIDTVFYIDPRDTKVYPLFLFYLFKTVSFKKIGSDTGVPGLNRDMAYSLEVSIPEDEATQQQIAENLSAFDDKIELNNKISKNLEQTAQAIFKEWLSKNQKSKIKYQKLDDLLKVISGYPFPSKLYSMDKKDFGVVTIKNVQDGKFITSCDSFIDAENIPKNINQECRIYDGDILLSLTGNVGRVCFVYGGKYLLNQRVAKLKPKNEKDRAFCYFLFRQASVQNQLINMAKGSAQPNLSPVETGKIQFCIPPREILDNFSKLASPIYQRLIKNVNENQKLAALRDLLLPKLMNGKIKV